MLRQTRAPHQLHTPTPLTNLPVGFKRMAPMPSRRGSYAVDPPRGPTGGVGGDAGGTTGGVIAAAAGGAAGGGDGVRARGGGDGV